MTHNAPPPNSFRSAAAPVAARRNVHLACILGVLLMTTLSTIASPASGAAPQGNHTPASAADPAAPMSFAEAVANARTRQERRRAARVHSPTIREAAKFARDLRWIECAGAMRPHKLRNGREVMKPAKVIHQYGRVSRKTHKFATAVEIRPTRLHSLRQQATPGAPVESRAGWKVVPRKFRGGLRMTGRQTEFTCLARAKAVAEGLVIEALMDSAQREARRR